VGRRREASLAPVGAIKEMFCCISELERNDRRGDLTRTVAHSGESFLRRLAAEHPAPSLADLARGPFRRRVIVVF